LLLPASAGSEFSGHNCSFGSVAVAAPTGLSFWTVLTGPLFPNVFIGCPAFSSGSSSCRFLQFYFHSGAAAAQLFLAIRTGLWVGSPRCFQVFSISWDLLWPCLLRSSLHSAALVCSTSLDAPAAGHAASCVSGLHRVACDPWNQARSAVVSLLLCSLLPVSMAPALLWLARRGTCSLLQRRPLLPL